MFQNSSAGGMDMSGSDVCKTPPVGTPSAYPNTVQGPTSNDNVPNILVGGGPVGNMNTIYSRSQGDEGGSQGGVASGVIQGQSQHVTGAYTVIIQGAPATRQTSTNSTNQNNTTGSRGSPSQTRVLLQSR